MKFKSSGGSLNARNTRNYHSSGMGLNLMTIKVGNIESHRQNE